jgi:hypothetical protein
MWQAESTLREQAGFKQSLAAWQSVEAAGKRRSPRHQVAVQAVDDYM